MKNILVISFTILLLLPFQINSNPFEKALKDLGKGLKELESELTENESKKKEPNNKNLPDAFVKANSNMATYQQCQNNGGKPKNNQRGFSYGFYDPCLPEEYIISPENPEQCINSKGETKSAVQNTDPNGMCNKALQIVEQRKMQKEKKVAANLETRVQQYRDKYEPMVQDRLDAFRKEAGKNSNIKKGYYVDEWGDKVWVASDNSQEGVRIFYDIKKEGNECDIDLETVLKTSTYDLPIKESAYTKVGSPAYSFPAASTMFIGQNSDNFKWAMPANKYAGIQVFLEFEKPLSTMRIDKNWEFLCWGANYLVKTATLDKQQKSICYENATTKTLMKELPLEGKPAFMIGGNIRDTLLHWAFEDFYSGKTTDGTQTLMFTMAGGSKTRVQLNPFHPAIKEVYEETCN